MSIKINNTTVIDDYFRNITNVAIIAATLKTNAVSMVLGG